jgi:hypothetical protein
LTRLLSDVKAGNVDVLVFCTSQALATTDELREKLTEFILGHGFNREHLTGDDLECYVRASAPDLIK